MNRRHWIRSLGLALAALPLLSRRLAADGEVPNLSDTLKFGLRCRRPEEFEFVALVVDKVEAKVLPLDMVLSMFKWSRERRPHFPFPYFQVGLQKRAAEIGVEL
jgi:hypothetical protein